MGMDGEWMGNKNHAVSGDDNNSQMIKLLT